MSKSLTENKSSVASDAIKLYTQKVGDVATIFLYGTIGERHYNGDECDDLTAMNVVKTIDKMVGEGAKRINVRINSNGGYTSEGLGIITAFKNCPVELHTYNDGVAYSMAADIWFAAKKENRHMAKGATLMIHAPSTWFFIEGTVKDFQAAKQTIMDDLDGKIKLLDSIAEGTIAVMAEGTGISADDIRKDFYDYADHTLSYQECVQAGFINDTETYTNENPTKSKGFLSTLKNILSPTPSVMPNFDANTEGVIEEDMLITKENLTEALKNGDLSLEDVAAIVQEQQANQPVTDQRVVKLLEENRQLQASELEKRDAVILKLQQDLEKIQNVSGGTPPTTPAGGSEGANDPTGVTKMQAEKDFDDYNKRILEAKKAG